MIIICFLMWRESGSHKILLRQAVKNVNRLSSEPYYSFGLASYVHLSPEIFLAVLPKLVLSCLSYAHIKIILA